MRSSPAPDAPQRTRAARGGARGAQARAATLVTPFARALELLGAFTPHDRWLANRDLADRTGLPPSTVARLAQTLVQLGMLLHDPQQRRYRLCAAVLGLGYGAVFNSDVQRVARLQMREHARQHKLHVLLGTRDRLDVIVLESASSADSSIALDLHAGVRMGIASSTMGWALLAALPELERYYLLEGVQRRMPRDWSRIRRRCGEAVEQVYRNGWCTSPGEWGEELGMVAAPLLVPGHPPMVLACVGASLQLTRVRVERELGPRLLALASDIQQACQGA